MDISIVLPAFNEDRNIKKLASEIHKALAPTGLKYEIVWVNDGSTDDTLFVMQNVLRKGSGDRVIDLRKNSGQTAALMAGIDCAEGRLVVTMDTDLQNDPTDIPKMVKKLEDGDYDMVIGWRKNRKDKAVSRKLPSLVANFLIRNMFGTKVHDRGCALKVMTGELAKELKLYGELHRFIAEIAGDYGARIAEVVVNHRPRERGKSKYGIMRTFKVILDIINLKFLLTQKTTPIQILGPIGMAFYGLSLVSGIMVVAMRILVNFNMTGNPLLIISALFFMTGSQFIVLGLMGELQVRTYYESNGRKIYSVRRVYKNKK